MRRSLDPKNELKTLCYNQLEAQINIQETMNENVIGILGRGLAVEENGRLRKDLRAPGRSSWQTEGLPPAILTPSVASRLAEGGGLRRGKVVGPERRKTRPETREQMRPPSFRGAAD
ncbi:hypothetical protein NDU88_008663 [Pleurodeles waltl]|uniref:Uncharacterized protein n=1 Tax=Pleurodeles waltl TaxID=8319 RepID=A0AAV7PXA4_PLEWA|nr:hypothetical protein NDU88_008663 [Pleurodeles waltl]